MSAVAVFTGIVEGDVVFKETATGCRVIASFTKVPAGLHGFHIHKGGDLRGVGCGGACEHYHADSSSGFVPHGDEPSSSRSRHTGDLGNISGPTFSKRYFLKSVRVADLYGRSVIVHEDEDDLGLGSFEDSITTGHSGKRIACAIIGRISCGSLTRKNIK
jgi:Cu/Zn superoxide dismutase